MLEKNVKIPLGKITTYIKVKMKLLKNKVEKRIASVMRNLLLSQEHNRNYLMITSSRFNTS